jgi:hypothetical protein
VLTGWDLQNAAGPVPGSLAPYSDGVNDYGNIDTTNLDGVFNGSELSAVIFVKIPAVAWGDGQRRHMLNLRGDSQNFLILEKHTVANNLRLFYMSGAVGKLITHNTGGDTNWISVGASVSAAADEVRFFVNGAQVGATATGLGAWAATGLDRALIGGASPSVPTNVFTGYLAYVAVLFGSIWTPAQFAAMHSAAATAVTD